MPYELEDTVEPAPADFSVQNEGSLFLFRPLNEQAEEHLAFVTKDNAEVMFYAGALVVEPRYAHSFAAALRDDGFTLR